MGCQSSKTQASAPTVAKGQENTRQSDVQTACGSDAVQEQPVAPTSTHAVKPEHEDPVVLMQDKEAQDKPGNDDQAVVVTEGNTTPVDEKPAILTEEQPTCSNLESASEEKEQAVATTAANEVQEAAEMHVHESAGGAAQDCLLSGQEHDGSNKLPGSGVLADVEVKQVRGVGIDCAEGGASACRLSSEIVPKGIPENGVQVSALPRSPQQAAPKWRSLFACCEASTMHDSLNWCVF